MRTALKVGFVVAATTLAWINVTVAVIAICASVLAVLQGKAGEVIEFCFGPLKAKLKEEIGEAEKLVQHLRAASISQAKAIIASGLRTGRFSEQTDWQYRSLRSIEASLRQLGVEEGDLRELRKEFIAYTIGDAGGMAMGHGHIPSKDGKLLESEWREAVGKYPDRDPAKIEQFLHRHGLMNADRQQRIDDMRWMAQHGDVRDEAMYLRSQISVPWM